MSDNKRKSILILDDEPNNITILAEILEDDYIIHALIDSTEAIATVEAEMPDVILLDIIMPEIDGYEIIKALKSAERTRNIPVIFITGLDSSDDEEKGLALGAADYISKPFHAPIVKIRVKNQIDIIERYEIENNLNIVLKLQSELVEARELAEQNRELAEQNREIAEKNRDSAVFANRAKTDFLTQMSHEMRTPMNAIIGMMQIIKMTSVPGEIKEYFDEIDIASNRLLVLIEDVLDVSSMEYGAFRLTDSVFSFNIMVHEVLKMVNHNAAEKNHTVNSFIDPALNAYFSGDGRHLKRVFTCILSNSVKFTPEGGEISFYAKKLNEENGVVTVHVEIADNGIGISDEQKERLFEMFDQKFEDLTRKHSGLGIGLALSKRIINMMDGDIQVESEEGKGTTISILIKLNKKKED